MQLGSTYTLTLGDTAQEIPLTQVATTYGVSGNMGGNRGGNMGGGMGDMGGWGGMNGGPGGFAPTSGTADSTTDRPTPPDGSTDGRPVTPRDVQTTPDQQAETGESFSLDKNGKVLLLASAATLALGLTVAFLYRKKG